MLRLRIHAGWDLQKWLWKISSQCGFCVCNMHPCWLLAWTKQPQSSQIYYSCFVVKNTHMHYGPTPTFWHSDTLISKPPCTSQYPTLGQFCCSCKRRCKKNQPLHHGNRSVLVHRWPGEPITPPICTHVRVCVGERLNGILTFAVTLVWEEVHRETLKTTKCRHPEILYPGSPSYFSYPWPYTGIIHDILKEILAALCCERHCAGKVWIDLFSYREGSLQNQYKVCLTDHLYPIMKQFSHDGNGLFKGYPIPIRRHEGSLNGLLSMEYAIILAVNRS